MLGIKETGRPRRVLDSDGFARRERLVADEIENTPLMLNPERQHHFAPRSTRFSF